MHTKAKKPAAAALIILLLGLTFTGICYLLFYLNRQEIKETLLAEAIKLQKGEIIIGDIHLELFSHLSWLAIRIDDLQFYEHPSESRPEGTPPIVDAKKMLVSFNPWKLFDGILDFQHAALIDGNVNLVFYEDYTFNVLRAIGIQPREERTTILESSAGEPFQMDLGLDAIELQNLQVGIHHKAADLVVEVLAEDVDAVFNYKKPLHEVLCAGEFMVKKFSIEGVPYPKPSDLVLDVDFWIDEVTKNGILNPSKVQLLGLELDVQGDFNISEDSAFLATSFDASSHDWSFLSLLVQENALKKNPDFLKSGDLYFNGDLNIGKGAPDIVVEFGAKGIDLETADGSVPVQGLSFKARFDSGDSADFSMAVLELVELGAKLPDGDLSASFRVENFVEPSVEFLCDLDADLTGLDRIFKTGLDSISGKLAMSSDLRMKFNNDADQTFEHSGKMVTSFDRIAGKLDSSDWWLTEASGRFVLSDSVLRSDALSMMIGQSDFVADFKVTNPVYWFIGQTGRVTGDLNLQSTFFDAPAWFGSSYNLGPMANSELELKWSGEVKKSGGTVSFPATDFEVVKLRSELLEYPDILEAQMKVGLEEVSNTLKIQIETLDLATTSGSVEIHNSEILLRPTGLEGSLKAAGSEVIVGDFDSLLPDSLPASIRLMQIESFSTNINGKWSYDSLPNLQNGYVDLKALTLDQAVGPDVKDAKARVSFSQDSVELSIGLSDLQFDSEIGNLGTKRALYQSQSQDVKFSGDISADNLRLDLIQGFLNPDSMESQGPNSAELDFVVDMNGFYNIANHSLTDFNLNGRRVEYRFGDSSFVSASGLEVELDELIIGDVDDSTNLLGIETINGDIIIDEFNSQVFKDLGLNLNLSERDSYYQMAFVLDTEKGTDESGKILVDYRGSTPLYQLQYKASRLSASEMMSKFGPDTILSGTIDFSVDLKTGGWAIDELLDHSVGQIVLSGDDITLYGVDLDLFLQKYQKSQNFNLVDVGAVFLMGPLGAVVTKGTDFVQVLKVPMSPDEKTSIPKLMSVWEFDSGMVLTRDVGFITEQNRVVVNGQINMLNDSIETLQVAVVDAKGCSLMDQEIWGKYDNIQLGELKVVGKLFGAVTNVLKLVAGKDCSPVYEGALEHPPKQ